MAINDYFFNSLVDGEGNYDRVYNAEDFVSYLDQIVGTGVFPNPSNQLQVRASSGMNIIVNEGQGWIKGHKLVNTADLTLTVSPANALLDRIDRVIFYTDETERAMGIEIKEGIASQNPTPPALTRTNDRYELCLANIRVRKAATSISGAMITDTRPDSSVCGWVAGLVQQIDTSSLFIQWDTAYAEFMAQMESWKTAQQNLFESWLSTLTSELQVGAYVKTFSKVVVGGQGVSNVIPLNMQGYEYDSHDIFLINLNGLMLVYGRDYTIDLTPEIPTVNINATLSTNNIVEITILKSVLGVPIEEDGDAVQYPLLGGN